MIKKSDGFMLVETVVASVVIVTAMVSLYSIFNKLYTSYKDLNNYYNVDAIYASKHMVRILKDNNINNFINEVFQENKSKILIDVNNKENSFYYEPAPEKESTKDLSTIYGIETMIIAEYDKTVLEKDVKDNYELNKTFKDYIDFVVSYYDVSDDDTRYSYIILTELNDGNNYYYANIGIE